MRPVLGLVMIVKDEARSIESVLHSVKGGIDKWCIIDTGSTDGTPDIIRRVLKDIPGTLHEEPFIDFETTRNRSLDLEANSENPAEWTLWLSGDEQFVGAKILKKILSDKDAPAYPKEDAIQIGVKAEKIINNVPGIPQVRIVRTGSAWRFKGIGGVVDGKRYIIHETLMCEGGKVAYWHGAPVYIRHRESDPARKRERILNYDLKALRAAITENPSNGHALFMAARSYEDLEMLAEAKTLYEARWRLGTEEGNDATQADVALLAWINLPPFGTVAETVVALEDVLCKRQPDSLISGEILFVLAHYQQHMPRLALALAVEAAGVCCGPARQVVARDTSMGWRAWRLAATLAEKLGEADRAKEYARKAMEAGEPQGGR